MRSKWRDVVWRGLRLLGAGPLLLRVHPSSGLRRAGWFRSFRHRDSIDRSGVALPWWGYAAIQFIEERIRRDARVLEFGSGNSTCWLAERVASIVTIENDPQWAERVGRRVPSGVKVVVGSALDEIALELGRSGSRFSVVINDALFDRMRCGRAALTCLAEDGVVIWDNTDGPDRGDTLDLMAKAGFREISFLGPAPQEVEWTRTSIFYRSNNVFGI